MKKFGKETIIEINKKLSVIYKTANITTRVMLKKTLAVIILPNIVIIK